MNIKYFKDTDTLYIELRKDAVTEIRRPECDRETRTV
jgi:uncharacterized protein YuzE